MALGDTYASVAELRAWAKLQTATNDALDSALKSASRGIEGVCHRQFNKSDTATSRVYYPGPSGIIELDDFWTTDQLVVKMDSTGDDTWATTITPSEFELHPLNGVVNGQEGWPFDEIWPTATTSVNWRRLARSYRHQARVQVTAKWGWAAVPEDVKNACMIVALESWKSGDTPFGVAGIGGDLGVLRVRENPMAMQKLTPYIKDELLVA
jgi:hypothetical protein